MSFRDRFKEYQLQWLAWVIILLATLAISLFFGVNYPVPEQPDQPPEPVELGTTHFSGPLDITESASASAPALTFEGDTDTGIFRSAANTLNIASGGTEMLEVDSSGFTISSGTALDVDTNVTIDGGLTDIGGATYAVADGDNDLGIAGTIEVHGQSRLEGNIDLNDSIDLDGDSDEVQLSVTGYTTQTNDLVQLDGGLTDVGGGTYATADGDNDVGVEGDLEANGALDVGGTTTLRDDVTLANGKTIYASTHATGTHGIMMLCYGQHTHTDVENVVRICDIPANANIIDYTYVVETDWNDSTAATVNCGIDGGASTDVDALIAADSINGIGNDTVIRMGATADNPASTTITDVGAQDCYVRCQVAETDNDASEGSASLYVWYQID
jgi:hypothetical protein